MGHPVSSTNKTDRHDITEILSKVALNTIKQTNMHTVTERNIAFLVPHNTCYLFELWEASCKFGSLPVDIKYRKEQSRDNHIVLLFNSKLKRRWINVIFLQDKHNINAVSYNITFM